MRTNVPPRSKPRGNPILARLAKVDARIDELEQWLEMDDERLNDQEAVLAEHNSDIALLADVALRTQKRGRAAVVRLARRAKRRTRARHRKS